MPIPNEQNGDGVAADRTASSASAHVGIDPRVSSPELDRALGDPRFVEDPFPVYRRLRDQYPVFWSTTWGVWILSRYNDVFHVLRDSVRFHNAGRFNQMLERLPAGSNVALQPLINHYTAGLLHEDPPRHTRLRALVTKPFSARMVHGLRDRVVTLAETLLDGLEPGESFDLVERLSYPLPVAVICDLLGVPAEDRAAIGRWSNDLNSLQGAGAFTLERALRASNAIVELEDYFRSLAAERSLTPRADLMSTMVAAREGDDRLSEEELLNMAVTFLVAGHETTKNLISSTVLSLLRQPADRRLVQTNPEMAANAVAETLRYESPVQRAWRVVAEPVELHGAQMKPGEIVFLMLGAANRDPSVFTDPDRFDLRRRNAARAVAFGQGPHYCLGAHLGQLEAEVAVQTLLRRRPHVRLDGDVTWNDSIHLHGPTSMWLAVESPVRP